MLYRENRITMVSTRTRELAAARLAGGARRAIARATASSGAVRDGVQRLADVDQAVIAALPAWRNPRGVAVAKAISAVAEPPVAGPLLAAAGVIAARRDGWRAAALPLVAVPGGVAARRMLSDLIARPRPPAELWLAEPEGYSLPSRHTTLAALTAGAVAELAGLAAGPRRAVALLAAATAGASRVYLGVHWPTDVLGGWAAGTGWALACWAISRHLRQRGQIE